MASNAPRPEARIAVFAKAPAAGAVKTRLAPLLGEAGAARLHAALVRRALATAVAADLGAVELWCAPDAGDPFFARCAREFGAQLRVQEGADLGSRMHAAFVAGARLVIGSDCPALAPAALRAAAAALAGHDAVFIPAEDGGYVLVGLARAVRAPFAEIAWGGPEVMAQTRARLAAAGLRWHELAPSWDVDRPEDYERLRASGLLAELAP